MIRGYALSGLPTRSFVSFFHGAAHPNIKCQDYEFKMRKENKLNKGINYTLTVSILYDPFDMFYSFP